MNGDDGEAETLRLLIKKEIDKCTDAVLLDLIHRLLITPN